MSYMVARVFWVVGCLGHLGLAKGFLVVNRMF